MSDNDASVDPVLGDLFVSGKAATSFDFDTHVSPRVFINTISDLIQKWSKQSGYHDPLVSMNILKTG